MKNYKNEYRKHVLNKGSWKYISKTIDQCKKKIQVIVDTGGSL